MKSLSKMILALVIYVAPFSAHAADGGAGPGGGDECEARIKNIKEDLESWIVGGGPAGLTLKAISKKQYSTQMLRELRSARIKCVGAGDVGYPVTHNGEPTGTPKVCRNEIKGAVHQITCDYQKFLNETGEAGQYHLIHHEYASMAGIEPPNNDDSNYEVSDQITGFLERQTVLKLAIKSSGQNGQPVESLPLNSLIRFTHDVQLTRKSEHSFLEASLGTLAQISMSYIWNPRGTQAVDVAPAGDYVVSEVRFDFNGHPLRPVSGDYLMTFIVGLKKLTISGNSAPVLEDTPIGLWFSATPNNIITQGQFATLLSRQGVILKQSDCVGANTRCSIPK